MNVDARFITENSSDEVFDLIHRLLDFTDEPPSEEKRGGDRRPIAMPVTVQPVDVHLQPVGPAFTAITRNISTGGIGIITTQPIETQWVQIRCAGMFADQALLLEIRYSNKLDEFYLIGGTFCVDINTAEQRQT